MRQHTATSAERPRDIDTAASAPRRPAGPAAVLALQRSCGNAAVAALLARAPAAQAGAYAAKPKPQDGLIGSGAAARLVTAAEYLGAEWDALATPEARADVLVRAANEELGALRVPAFTLDLTDLHQVAGQFNYVPWQMQLNRRTFAGALPEGNGVEDLALTFAHETRHCEQWFRMARLEAGRGKPAGEITREMGVTNADIAPHAHRQPLDPASPEAAEAAVWFDSVYGTGAQQRALTLGKLEASYSALVQSAGLYREAKADFQRAAPKQKAAAKVVLDRCKNDYLTDKAEYAKWSAAHDALPEEADADQFKDLVDHEFDEPAP